MSFVVEFVKAYRTLGRPAVTGSSFTFSSAAYSTSLGDALNILKSSSAGRIDELLINGKETSPQAVDLSTPWSTIEFLYTLGTSGEVPIFINFEQLMARSKSYLRTPLPPHFYLVEGNVLSSEEPIDPRVKSLSSICKLIVYLADLAHFHDEKNSSDEYKLVFITDDPAKGERAITLYPYLDKELIQYDVGTELLDSLQAANLDGNPHLVKERSIFRATLIEHLVTQSDGKERFKLLLRTWKNFTELYEKNLSTYLSGFSFHKAKQEVATAQLTIADQISKVVSDISGKILSVPISLVATIAITKADGVLESSILVLGILVTAALIAEALAAQKLQYDRIRHSSEIMFSAHQLKINQYPEDLRTYLSDALDGLDRNEKKLQRTLYALRTTAWIPALLAISLHASSYQIELKASWDKILGIVTAALHYTPC